ncbi:transporter substrate-binding domain-containing protein [Nocardioides sp. Kera G14]|uniref:transporter substrate-binding domain-containing protein n=1 Tax=Nocardioides sp. Kera G14 TaxID=2884264 RepID=UPI001D0F7ED8|nr:transporter substrate-binding domain-containing protein [Nocardioides sp. Kera G14]UDY24325.1 transporter substrate-binding domain-containing protein [Nocardioides sp. Kera G14]
MKITTPVAPLLGLALAATLALSGCGNSTDALSAADKEVGGTTTTKQDAIPTQDVVSSIQTDKALHDRLPAEIKSSGTLSLGTTEATGTSFLPHGGTDDAGKQIGLDVDIRDAVAKLLGVKLDVQFGSFETIVPGTQNGKYNVGEGNFAVTSERLKVVDYATYLKDGQSFVAPASSDLTKVSDITDVCGKSIATSPGSSFQQILESNASTCAAAGKEPYKVSYYKDGATILLSLQNGKADLYFGPTLSLKYLVDHQSNLKYLGELSLTDVGFVVAKGSPLAPILVDAVNELIETGDYDKIFDKWSVGDIKLAKSEFNPKPAF